MPPSETTSVPPSPTLWRREHVLHTSRSSPAQTPPSCTNEAAHDLSPPATVAGETTALYQPNVKDTYGTVPTRRLFNRPSFSFASHRLPRLQKFRSTSHPSSPLVSPTAPTHLLQKSPRPASVYDAPLKDCASADADADARVNGIRVWYSSFTSIDWLHDAIKDSARFARLRKRRSLRSRIRLLLDRGLGWLIVTLVGFLTAVVAFLVISSEQWLFDLKEGYCRTAWWKAKRSCCFTPGGGNYTPSIWLGGAKESCSAWQTWSEVVSPQGRTVELAVKYLSHTSIAVGHS